MQKFYSKRYKYIVEGFGMMVKNCFSVFVAFLIALVPSLQYSQDSDEKECCVAPQWITVYVHGTRTAVGLSLAGKWDKSLAWHELGLKHVSDIPKETLFVQDVALLTSKNPERFDQGCFYHFGWSGKLSFCAREKAGQDLYNELTKLLKKYKAEYGYCPKVRIMTFSHGGNVALNMVKSLPFLDDEHVHLELLLIANPVQKTTEHLIEHDEIDRAYVISSTKDVLQVADMYRHGSRCYLPNRFFNTQKPNCIQVKVLINNRGLCHTDLLRSFMYHLPYTMEFADECCKKQILSDDEPAEEKSKCDHRRKNSQKSQKKVIECTIQDDKFTFFNGVNLFKAVHGERKK